MATPTKRKPTAAKKKATPKAATKVTKKVAPKTAPQIAAKPVVAKVVNAAPAAEKTAPTAPAVEAPVLRKKELIDRVVARSGIKKKDAKPTIEAMLAVLGEALQKGEELNLHPMGKMKVTRVIEKPNATVMVTKVRRRLETAGGTVVKMTPQS